MDFKTIFDKTAATAKKLTEKTGETAENKYAGLPKELVGFIKDFDAEFEKAIKECAVSLEEAVYINAAYESSPMKRESDELLMLIKFRKFIEKYPQSIYL